LSGTQSAADARDDRTVKLKDKVALVTGGARGIGAAIADRYVAEGARVAVADISLAGTEETAARHGDKAFAVALDVKKIASIEAAVESVVQRWGGVDILVNNAGVFDMAPIVEVTEASYDKVFAVNVKGLFFTLQAVAKRMIARGRGGKIINMASQAGRRGEALVSVYCASKAAVISLRPGSTSSSTASTSMALRPGSWTRLCGPRSTPCSRNMSIVRSARRNAWSARRSHSAEWDCRTTTSAPPCSLPRRTAITSSRRRSTSTAATG
jgi:NAD(P)-dependent dehydrogenase (short-subunit alcohol dehydrogenase family)